MILYLEKKIPNLNFKFLCYCGIINFRWGQFSWIVRILQVRGIVISCILLYFQKETRLYYLNLLIRGGC